MEFKKGCIPWNKGLTKENTPQLGNSGRPKGIPCTEEQKKVLSKIFSGKKRKPLTEEWKKNLSNSLKGRICPMKGKHHTQKVKEKIRKIKLQLFKDKTKHPRYNTKQTEETKRKIGLKSKGRISKEKHPLWKGGITPYAESLRKSVELKNWRKAVYKRDDYTCQNPDCKFCNNQIGGQLNAHHEIPFAECLDLGFEEMMFNVDNGTTYCKDYHQSGGLHG